MGAWNAMPTSLIGPVIGSPRRRICPDVGCAIPQARLMKVLLPQPLGPTSERNSASATEKVRSASAVSGFLRSEKYVLVRCSTSSRFSGIGLLQVEHLYVIRVEVAHFVPFRRCQRHHGVGQVFVGIDALEGELGFRALVHVFHDDVV